MIDDGEVRRAKAVLRNAGYYCVPRERVITIGGCLSVSHMSMLKYGSDPRYVESTIKNLHQSALAELMRVNAANITSDNDDLGTNYRLKLDVLPAGLVTDPILELWRERQG